MFDMFLIMYLMIINEHYPWCFGAEWGFSTFVEGGARVISSELRFRHKSLVGTRSLVLGSEVYQNLRTVLNMRTPSLRIRKELSAIECTLSKSFNVTQYVSTSFDRLLDGKHVTIPLMATACNWALCQAKVTWLAAAITAKHVHTGHPDDL